MNWQEQRNKCSHYFWVLVSFEIIKYRTVVHVMNAINKYSNLYPGKYIK